jgi:hypothetical protein
VPRFALVILLLALTALSGAAQRSNRIATTHSALTTFPLFFHGKQIVIRANTTSTGDTTRLNDTAKPIFVVWRERSSRKDGEIRGEFWDLGRLQEDDSRLSGIDFRPILEQATQGRWPGRDQVFVITGATYADTPLPTTPGVRAIALAPDRYENSRVTLVGRFRGFNLYGDLPQGLGKSKWDFVLHSADGAVWVSGVRPRGKDFDLNPSARVDTSRWLEVTGTVRRDGPQVWIEGESVKLATAPEEAPVEVAVVVKEAPPRVIFSAPVANDTDVERSAAIRIQFSRDMDGKSFRDRVRVTTAAAPGVPAPPLPPFAATYNDGNRALEIRFKQPLERFLTVKIDLLEGITATDGQPLPPWSLTFTTGASLP